jgi:preprotein translocase subunit SecD
MRYIIPFLLFSSTALAVDHIDQVTIQSTGETIEFTNAYNLDKCLEFDRLSKKITPMPEKKCNGLKQFYARKAEAQKLAEEKEILRQEAMAKQAELAEQQRQVEAAEKAKRDEAYAKQREAEEQQRLAQEAADEREYQLELKRERAASAKQQKQVAEKRAICGDDYQNPKIGMSLARLNQCVAKVKLVSQINRADGVVSTYQSGNLTVHAMDNLVISWNRY